MVAKSHKLEDRLVRQGMNRRYKLTGRQLQFCREYIKHNFNGQKACLAMGIKAHIARKQAWMYLQRVQVKDFIHKSLTEAREKVGDTFKDNHERCRHVRDVCVPLEEKDHEKMNIPGGMQAMDMLNKLDGNYAPDKSANLEVKIDSDLKTLAEEIKKHEKEY